jgi:hypothetical protein
VEAHSYAYLGLFWPRLVSQRLLDLDSASDRLLWVLERPNDTVTFTLIWRDLTTQVSNRVVHDRVMSAHSVRHRDRKALPELGRTLNIGH